MPSACDEELAGRSRVEAERLAGNRGRAMADAGCETLDAAAEGARRVQRRHTAAAAMARERLEDPLLDQSAARGVGLVFGGAAGSTVGDLGSRTEPHLPSSCSHPEAPVEV